MGKIGTALVDSVLRPHDNHSDYFIYIYIYIYMCVCVCVCVWGVKCSDYLAQTYGRLNTLTNNILQEIKEN